MARSKIVLNHDEIQTYLDGEHGVREMLRKNAELVLAAAQADPHDDSGDYENGLQIQEAHTDRLSVRVVGTDWKSHILEARYGILARALDSARGGGG